jgi:hypothetical protein
VSVAAIVLRRWPLGWRQRLGTLPIIAVATVAALAAGDILANRPTEAHLLLALVACLAVAGIALTSPRAAIVTILLVLPFLALARRLLILFDGWHRTDPLLLVTPFAAVLLLQTGRRLGTRPGTVSKLVLGVLGLSLIESANPLGGSLRSGIVGLLFVAAPLLWFFVGRNIGDRRLVRTVVAGTIAVALPIAFYGLSQTINGLNSWDAAWVGSNGYGALQVGDLLRGFGTFSSAAEYATYLGIAFIAVVALAFHRRIAPLLALPLLGYAIFLESSRGIVVILVGVTILLAGIRTRRLAASVAVMVVVVSGLWWAYKAYAPTLATKAAQSGNALVIHQVGGLTHPLDQHQSTLGSHWSLLVNGFRSGLSHPLGLGTGATNIAGARFGGVAAGTEVDVSNEFVSLGLLGGFMYLAIVFASLRHGLALYARRSDAIVFAVLGILLVTLGQWLNGGYYAVAPLLWFLIGWVEREHMGSARSVDSPAGSARRAVLRG